MSHKLYLLFICIAVFVCPSCWAQQVSKTVHQTFTLDGAEKVTINVVGSKVEMRETKGSRILVETTIKLTVSNERLLDFVVNSGRYDLEKEFDATKGEVVIASKKSNNVIMIQGSEIHEELSYVFYIPTAVKYANKSTIRDISKE